MKAPDKPADEIERQAALVDSGLLDSGPEERFDRITRLAQRLFNVPIALVSLVDGNRQWFKSCQGLAASETPRSVSFCGHAILSDDLLLVENALDDARFADNPLVTGPPHIRFYAGAPLHWDGYRIGTLCVIDDKPRRFTEQDQLALSDLARTLETLIASAARERPGYGLASDLGYAHKMMESMREGLSVISPDGVQQKVNPAFCQMTGFAAEELLGQTAPYPYWPEEQYEVIEQALSCVMNEGSGKFELIFKKKTGERFPVVLSVNSLKDAHGDFICFFANVTDITEVRRSVESLKESERRAQLVIEGTNVGTWQWNVQTGETVFNARWAEIVGYTLEELAPVSIDTWMSLAHPDDLEQSASLLNRHFSGELPTYDCKARMRHKQGHWVWVYDRGKVFEWTPEGEPLLMYGTHGDITAEVEAEQALQASRDEYASLVANMPSVTYRCLPDEHWTMLYISKQVESVSGYSAEELLENASISYAALIHPDDAEAVEKAVHEGIASQQPWHVEYRIRHKQGNWRWVEERGRPVTGDADHPLVLEGFLVDVTRDKQAREQLARHHDALVVLNRIAFHASANLDEKIRFALEQAREFLHMDAAIVSQVEGEVYSVRWLSAPEGSGLEAGQKFRLGDTWCRVLLDQSQGEQFLPDATDPRYRGHICYQRFPVGSYMGLVIEVENRLFGTLNFTAQAPRSSDFDESETLFVRLLAQWLVNTLETNLGNLRLDKLMAELPGVVYQFRRFPDGRTTFPFSSPGIRSLYGISPEQAAEDAGPAYQWIHPEDLPAVVQSIEHSAETLANWRATYRVRNDQGRYRWVYGQARPEALPDGSVLWHGYLQDIDDQEQVRQAMERSEVRLRSLFEFSPIGIALNDFETGQFLDINPALLAPTGYGREEFVQLSYWEVTPKEYEPEEAKALEDLKSKGRYGPFEKEYIRKDGSRYPVRLQGVVTQDADGRQLIWSLIEDISERRRLDRMKNQFIATVSHELRTPLTSIAGSLGLLAGGAVGHLPQKAESLLANAQRNAQRLSSLINDLLDMEKLVAGKMSIKASDQAVLPVVREAIESMQDYARQRQVSLELVNPLPDVQAAVDAERLIQALTNLLSNAVKYSPEGEVVALTMAREENRLLLTVQDRGPGVDAKFKDQLFKRFSQADSSDTRKMPGTGLGLAITREIIHQLGGDVGYDDAPDGGSLFWVRLPITRTEKPQG